MVGVGGEILRLWRGRGRGGRTQTDDRRARMDGRFQERERERGREEEVARGCWRPARHSLHRPRENDRRRGRRRQRRRRRPLLLRIQLFLQVAQGGEAAVGLRRERAREREEGGRAGSQCTKSPTGGGGEAYSTSPQHLLPPPSVAAHELVDDPISWCHLIFEGRREGTLIFLFARPPRIAIPNLTAVRHGVVTS